MQKACHHLSEAHHNREGIPMTDMTLTLGEILSDPKIRQIAPDAIRAWDLTGEEMWNKTLEQLKKEHFGGNLAAGFDRLFAAAESGEWYYPLYSDAECEAEEARRGVNMVWFPSEEKTADERPYILLVPGGGFVNVWNLTEGWPVAAQFNRLGYHVFILTYQVSGEKSLLDRNMGDFARALELIRREADHFHVQAERYMTCGFSAGGYLVSLWNTIEKGYSAFRLPKPQATFPVYPFISPKRELSGDAPETDTDEDLKEDLRLYGCTVWEAVRQAYEIPEHVEGFPPCALFLAAGDELVSPEHSKMLAAALEKRSVPCRLEIGPDGGHGFADGTDMCMAGWTERAVRWFESLNPD